MKQFLCVLHLENGRNDVGLVRAMLDEAGLACRITAVQDRNEFEKSLEQDEYDVILADCRLPIFDDVAALRLVLDACPDVPFTFVSGAMDEGAALEALKDATGSVSKQKMMRIVPPVKRALYEAESRREPKRAEREDLANLRFFESMDKVNRAIQGADDLEKMMGDLLDVVLSIFDCDRAYLICPCDPDSQTWDCLIQRYKPEYPGVIDFNLELPMVSQMAEIVHILLSSESPVSFGPGAPYMVPADVSKKFDVKCFMSMAIYPKVGRPWQFGMQQCSHARVWSKDENRLFESIGRRLADGLSSLLSYRDLQESEERYRRLADNATDVIWTMDMDRRLTYVSPSVHLLRGYTADEAMEQSMDQFLTPQSYEIALDSFHRELEFLKQNGVTRAVMLELEQYRKDGTTVWTQSQMSFLADSGGEPKGILGITRDITERKQAEKALKESEEQFRIIVKNSTPIVFLTDQDGKVLLTDGKMLAGMGLQPGDLVGESVFDLWQDYPAITNGFRMALSGELFEGIIELDELIFEVFYSPNKDLDGNIIGVVGMGLDITERKRVENALKRSEREKTILNQIANIFLIIPEEEIYAKVLEIVLQVIKGECGLFGYIGENGDLILPSLTRGIWEEYQVTEKSIIFPQNSWGNYLWSRSIREKKSYYSDDPFHTPEGRILIDHYLAVPIVYANEAIGLICVANKEKGYVEEDQKLLESIAGYISPILNARLQRDRKEQERKTAEEELRQLNMELDRRVLERTAQLEAVNKELEAFAYSVSHDLRAPLRHIDGFIELLQKKSETLLDDQGRHYMDAISEAAKKMGLLIDELLSFSRRGRQEISLQQVDLGSLVRDVISELEPDAAGRNIDWCVNDLPVVEADAAILRIVLVNLIANALKFTRPRQQARIDIGSQPGQNGEAVIYVRDNGVGFDMAYSDKLFGVFQRLHQEDEFEGTGIGLANVRRIIARHGGRVWAEAKVEQGATFYFSLPQT